MRRSGRCGSIALWNRGCDRQTRPAHGSRRPRSSSEPSTTSTGWSEGRRGGPCGPMSIEGGGRLQAPARVRVTTRRVAEAPASAASAAARDGSDTSLSCHVRWRSWSIGRPAWGDRLMTMTGSRTSTPLISRVGSACQGREAWTVGHITRPCRQQSDRGAA